MKKVLIVLNDAILLSVFKSWAFRARKKDILFFAKEGKEAIEIMRSQPINLLITELSLSEIDGLELATAICVPYPQVKIAFFILPALAENEALKQLTSIYFINRPNSLREFIHLDSVIEVADFQALPINHIAITEFLTLIAYQKKTCLLGIKNEITEQKGLMYFQQGVLYDAVYGDLKAEPAVIEMLNWEWAKFSFKAIANKQFRRQIQTTLTILIQRRKNFSNVDTLISEINMAEESFQLDEQARLQTELAAKLQMQALEKEQAIAALVAETQTKLQTQQAQIQKATAALQTQLASEAEQLAQQQVQARQREEAVFIKISKLDLLVTLGELQEIKGYVGSAIFDMSGQVALKHSATNATHSIEEISNIIIEVIQAAVETVSNAELGAFNFLQITADGGIFEAVWAVENQFIVAILLKPEAKNTGLAKIQLLKVGEIIHGLL